MPETRPQHNQAVLAVATVRSADGTSIGYRRCGSGPGLIVLHGALESSTDYEDLAALLSESFTVHLVDRRGRGLSGPHGDSYGLASEVDDVRAIAEQTAATSVFGVSSGGVVALQAALQLPQIGRVAVYEPALNPPGTRASMSEPFVERYERAIAQGRDAEAIVSVLKGIRVGPRWLRWLPGPLATALIGRFLAEEDMADNCRPTFGSLVPTMHYDFLISDEGSADFHRFSDLEVPVMLVGGSRSPRYLAAALNTLEGFLPHAERVRIPKVGHNAAANRREGGRPDLVACQLHAFLMTGGARSLEEMTTPVDERAELPPPCV